MLFITRRRGIQANVAPTVPAHGVLGRAPTVNAGAEAGLEWPVHSPAYGLGPTALPGHAGFGMDSQGGWGRHLSTPVTTVILVEPGNGNSGGAITGHGANVFRGTWDYAWRHVASPKVIIPLCSGFVAINNDPNSALGGDYISYCGQFAPSPGLFLRATNPRLNGGSDCQIWHLRSYMGDDVISGFSTEIRDCFAHGNSGITDVVRNVFINCEFAWSVDELADFSYTFDGVTMLYCAFIDPLHAPPNLPHTGDPVGTDHGFGPIIGGEGQPVRLSIMRSLFAHTTGRNPLTSATRYTHANNLHYNHGRPVGVNADGNAIHWHSTNSLPMEANILGNVFVRGPNNRSNLVAAACQVSVASGSGCFLNFNAQHGWAAPASQNSFMTSSPSGFVQSTIRTNALPSHWGDSALTGLLRVAANPLAPTTAELNDFVDLIDDSVGAQPGYRSTTVGRVANVLSQIRARIAGTGSTTSQFIDTVAQAGGWFSVPSVTVNPLNPGSAWHAALPTGADRDEVLTSGTLLNGSSAVGRTRLEAWALNQHYYVGGK
jgi:hypothetical protein